MKINFIRMKRTARRLWQIFIIFLAAPHGGWVNGVRVGGFIFSEMITDIMDCYWNWNVLHDHTYTPTWATDYANQDEFDIFAISRDLTICRGTMLRIQNADISETIKNKYVAEARLIHAYIALHLYKFIGPVPIVPDDDILNPAEVKYYERPTDAEFVQMIKDDVIAAMPYLPDPQEQDKSSEWGKMNNWNCTYGHVKALHDGKGLEKCPKVCPRNYRYGLL